MEEKAVFFFDIDNCLYPRSLKILDLMSSKIDDYFKLKLDVSEEEALRIHTQYMMDYGLAIEGLVRHHSIDPLDYNSKVDDSIPIFDIIKPDPKLRSFLESFNRSKVKLWLLTNAYKTHASRVIKALDVEDLFEGCTFCDYTEPVLVCKPKPEMFTRAMQQAGVTDKNKCYFVDDSAKNVRGAKAFGWKLAAHFLEPEDPSPAVPVGDCEVRDLAELKTIVPELFV
ncbi:HAD-like domain-containing protein [Limtongia smithiae]|uniref:HAD-like domain-containing protein n=1 Tax=Limtongia smithiae TaxID=1125753 RepID=UPI0034CF916B